MKIFSCKTIVFAAALISTIAVSNVPSASELSRKYGYVGFEPHVALAALFGPTKVKIYDQNNKLLVTKELSAGDVVFCEPEELGLSGLSYVRIVSTRVVACYIEEIPEDGEHGHTEPQSRLFDSYTMPCPSPNYSGDDLFRFYAPRDTRVRVFDQHRELVDEFLMERGEVRQFSAGGDWGLSSPYAVRIRATNPIAVSFMDAPGATTLMIPQGFDSLP